MHGAINGSPGLTLESLRFEQMLRRIRDLARRRLLLRSEQMLRRVRDFARRHPFATL